MGGHPGSISVDLGVRLPELVVFDERPGWIDQAEYGRIAERSGFPFDKPDNYWRRFYRPS